MMHLYDFDSLPLSDRNGTYGGDSGDKEGVIFRNQYWIIKYPKSTKGMTRVGSLSYTSSPLSEYIGSHIYSSLGYDVHDTLLGIRNGRIVVACRDLCDDEHRLIEFRQLKNTYNRQLSEKLDGSFHSTEGKHFTDLDVIIAHLEYNPELQNIDALKSRFWDCVIIDGLINNNDRNSGNWGILRSKKENILCPVYDNGSSFSPNIPESRIRKKLADRQMLLDGALNGITAYSLDGENSALFRDLLKAGIPEIDEALIRTAPLIREHLAGCRSVIGEIPERYNGYPVISPERKLVYMDELTARCEQLIEPAYEKAYTREIHKKHH